MNAPLDSVLRIPAHLRAAGLASEDPGLDAVADRYAVSIPASLAADIARGGREGPVGRQYLPSSAELTRADHEQEDPTGDNHHSPVKGIVHRHADRVLLMPTQICAVYCRFCFRRERVGPSAGALTDSELMAALDYVRTHNEIWEVILSGGDPLVLSPRRLGAIVNAVDRMAHVRVLRVHSRVPVAAPEMLDDGVIETLASSSKPVFMVFHCNHAEELTPRVRRAITHLRDAGLSLLSQSVLLAGVNDSVAALESLFRTLVEVGIKPYYLHQLDAAPGTSQFAVPIARGRALMKSLRARVSGLALPTFVVDVPGGSGKVPIGPDYLRGVDGGFERVEGLDGETHHLPPAVTEPCQ